MCFDDKSLAYLFSSSSAKNDVIMIQELNKAGVGSRPTWGNIHFHITQLDDVIFAVDLQSSSKVLVQEYFHFLTVSVGHGPLYGPCLVLPPPTPPMTILGFLPVQQVTQ